MQMKTVEPQHVRSLRSAKVCCARTQTSPDLCCLKALEFVDCMLLIDAWTKRTVSSVDFSNLRQSWSTPPPLSLVLHYCERAGAAGPITIQLKAQKLYSLDAPSSSHF